MPTQLINAATLGPGQSIQSTSVSLGSASSISVSCKGNTPYLASVTARLMFLVSGNEWIEAGAVLLTPTAPSQTFSLAAADPQALARTTQSTFIPGVAGITAAGKSSKGARSAPNIAPQATWSVLFDSVTYTLNGGATGASTSVSASYQ
jgi:hypothetical protein